MKHFTATEGIFDTARNARAFLKDNTETFWSVFKPLIPYIAGLLILDTVMSLLMQTEFTIGSLISNYFFAALAITWHRIVLLGPDRFEPMNPFKPQRHELIFMLMGVGIAILIFLITFLLVGISALLGQAIAVLSMFIAVFLAIFLSARFSFYFPAKAVNAKLGLGGAFKLSKGYVVRLMCTPFFASWRLVLGMIGVLIVTGVIVSFIPFIGSIEPVFMLIAQLPILFYFQPLLTVIGITVLSNFYQHALQNSDESASSET